MYSVSLEHVVAPSAVVFCFASRIVNLLRVVCCRLLSTAVVGLLIVSRVDLLLLLLLLLPQTVFCLISFCPSLARPSSVSLYKKKHPAPCCSHSRTRRLVAHSLHADDSFRFPRIALASISSLLIRRPTLATVHDRILTGFDWKRFHLLVVMQRFGCLFFFCFFCPVDVLTASFIDTRHGIRMSNKTSRPRCRLDCCFHGQPSRRANNQTGSGSKISIFEDFHLRTRTSLVFCCRRSTRLHAPPNR